MNGKEILVDTNIFLYLLNGSIDLENFLNGKHVSLCFITELELIGFSQITLKEENDIARLLLDCSIIPLSESIKRKYVEIRRTNKIKLADALIAATAIVLDIPLITADADFKKITALNLITYSHGIDLA